MTNNKSGEDILKSLIQKLNEMNEKMNEGMSACACMCARARARAQTSEWVADSLLKGR